MPTVRSICPDRMKKLDALLQSRYINTSKIPGALTLVHHQGELVHKSSHGWMNVENQTPVAMDTIFRIYSMSKPITTVAFMMLVEEGLVSLDQPVHTLIPEWEGLGVFEAGMNGQYRTQTPERTMLVIDLLRHTAGLTYGFQGRSNVDAAYREVNLGEPQSPGGLEAMIQQLGKIPLDYSPGSVWTYSVATHVLGYLVGKISGLPFDQFLKERIFQPLGMEDTGFFVPADKAHRLAACYAPDPNGGMVLFDDPATSPFLSNPPLLSGGSGMVSTASDYLAFCQMLLNGGSHNGTQLLSPKTIELMTQNHLPDGKSLAQMSQSSFSEAGYPGIGFGLGFAVTLDVAKTMTPGSAGDYFWGGGGSTYFWIDPVENLIVIFMTQLLPSTTYPIRRDLRTMVYSAFSQSR